ncbi:MAG: phosphatase PAP2 family protein [Prevotella sp.]|nr:phosphatase PAP2 family protein [Prevotella sp.]
MKYQRRLWHACLLLYVSIVVAHAQTVVTYPQPFLNDSTRPDGLKFIPAPPQNTDPAFCCDFYYYQWGKQQRDTPFGTQARLDGPQELYEAFSGAFGMTISPELTPEINNFAGGASGDGHRANKRVKDYYKRIRPYVVFAEPSLVPETDEKESTSYCYPSGHATRGYVYAMALALIEPDSADVLMKRAYDYALGRVVAGYHYKSDIDASAILAASVMRALAGNDAFKKQMEKAKKEYAQLKKKKAAKR